jgi:mono/diheme cytochrome c family protein
MKSGSSASAIAMAAAAGLLLLAAGCKIGGSGGNVQPAKWQGWTDQDRSSWYQATQGSRLVPWAWAQALERAEDQQHFFSNGNLQRYRFVPYGKSVSGLPIGFARDDSDDSELSFTKLRWYSGQPSSEQWLGLNCSACHTAQLDFAGKPVTLDGGPSLVDFQSFISDFDAAMEKTQSDPAKWRRFADLVLKGKNDPNSADPARGNEGQLKAAFASLLQWERDNAHLNHTDTAYGYGRLDAVGHIFNKVAQLAVYQKPGVRPTPNAPDAPVSYPFLWDIYRQSQLQWNGIVKVLGDDGKPSRIKLGNGFLDYSALGRNVGEVIGVFGDVVITPSPSMTGYKSSIHADALDRLETMLRRLEPPKWPGTLDANKVAAGQALYESKGCKGCHTIEPAGDAVYRIHMIAQTRNNRNDTDPWMACNAITYVSAAGKLQGQPEGYLNGAPLTSTAKLATMLRTTVIGTLLGKGAEIIKTATQIFFGVEPPPRVVGALTAVSPAERRAGRLEQCYNDKSGLFAYKARPLDGIWATAPYLHNGSVPTLYDLLRDPKDRPASFNIGTRAYDPVKAGYATDAGAAGNGFTFNTAAHGNSNQGHDYNVGKLTEEERLALLEYLKSL